MLLAFPAGRAYIGGRNEKEYKRFRWDSRAGGSGDDQRRRRDKRVDVEAGPE